MDVSTINTRNYSQKTNYKCGSETFDLLPFYATSVTLPGVTQNLPEISGRNGAPISMSPANITFNGLSVSVLLDEDYKIWIELMNKIRVNPEEGTFNNEYFDFWIEVTNDMGHHVMKIEYYSCNIESITDLELATNDDITEQTFTLEIKYDYFKIIQNNVPSLKI